MKQIVVWLTKILSRVEAMCAEKADKIIITKLYKCYLLGSGVHYSLTSAQRVSVYIP